MAALPFTPSLVAVMFDVPAASAVIRPAAVTVATAGEELAQETDFPVITFPLESFGVAVACAVSPTEIDEVFKLTNTLATAAGVGVVGVVGVDDTPVVHCSSALPRQVSMYNPLPSWG